jgi:hypothetical protein
MLLSKQASAQTDDVDIANFALTLEYLEAEFYAMAVGSGVISGDALGVVENLADHEAQHVTALTDPLNSVGPTPVEKPTFTFPEDALSSQASILDLAATLEPVGVGAFLGAADLETGHPGSGRKHRRSRRRAHRGTELAAWRRAIRQRGFPKALTLEEVSAAVAPFLGGKMLSTGGP